MTRRVLVIGSTNVDFIMKLPHLPAKGQTVTDGRFMQTFGGKGANQAVAAARAGGSVTFLTCLGEDAYARQITDNFQRDRIDTSRIVIESSQPTGSALVMFDERGDNYLAVAPGSNYALTPAHVRACADLFTASDMLVMQMELTASATQTTLRLAESHHLPVIFNYAPVRDAPVPVGPAMTTLVVNEQEAGELAHRPVTNAEDAATVARKLRESGPRIVVVTLGAQGVVAVADGQVVTLAALPVKPVDTTAAGDTFCGALGVALAEQQPLADAIRFANAAAAVCVTAMGAQPSIPHRAVFMKLLNR
jgi:ribokinase